MWNLFRFENGSNPYITKTEKEFKRIMKKYKNKIIKTGDATYLILK